MNTGSNAEFSGLRQYLLGAAEEDYRRFNARLLPGVENILGVRLPLLRRLARRICKGNWRAFLEEYPAEYYEEIMLKGLVTAGAAMPMAERLERLRDFLPLIDNWAVCDSTENSLRPTDEEKEQLYGFLLEQAASPLVYSRRFVLVTLLGHYLEPECFADICRLAEEIEGGEYYVDMAKAWLLAEFFAADREAGLAYLAQSGLDDFTYNKTLQKIRESRKVAAEDKELLLGWRRGNKNTRVKK